MSSGTAAGDVHPIVCSAMIFAYHCPEKRESVGFDDTLDSLVHQVEQAASVG